MRFYYKILLLSIFISDCCSMGPKPYTSVNPLVAWVESKGGLLPNMMIVDHSEGYRSTYALSPIKKGEEILFVPLECIITQSKVYQSHTGKVMKEAKLALYSYGSTYMAMFLLYH